MLTHHEAVLRGRIGAFALHATHDSRVTTAPARAAFLSRFEREVDPDGLLTETERRRRAEFAKRAYFARLALASARARRQAQAPPSANGGTAVGKAADDVNGVRDATRAAPSRSVSARSVSLRHG